MLVSITGFIIVTILVILLRIIVGNHSGTIWIVALWLILEGLFGVKISDNFVGLNIDYVLVLQVIVGYIVIGFIWSLIKWNFKVKSVFKEFQRHEQIFNIEGSGREFKGEENIDSFNKYMLKAMGHFGTTLVNGTKRQDLLKMILPTPNDADNIMLILNWMWFWPFNFIVGIFRNTFELFSDLYEKISVDYTKR